MPKHSKVLPIPGRTKAEIFVKVSETIEQFLAHVSLGPIEVERVEAELLVRVKSKVANATLTAHDERLELFAELSLLAMPFRSKLDEGLEKWVKRNFS